MQNYKYVIVFILRALDIELCKTVFLFIQDSQAKALF